jgi:hypothetical protein
VGAAFVTTAQRAFREFLMLNRFLKSGCLALALVLVSDVIQPLFAQHHHHHHHHHGGGGISFGGGGFRLSIGSGGYGYGGYGGYNNLRYYNSYPSYGYSNYYGSGYGYVGTGVYVTPQYVTPQVVTPVYVTPRSGTSSPVYSTPSSVRSTSRISLPAPDNGQRTNLPGVSFGGRAHIPELAIAVADRTNQLCVVLADSYRDNPQFNEVYRDTYSVIGLAQQLAQPDGAADSAVLLATLSDLNAILAQTVPRIESWKPNSGGSASATSHLSSVQSALKLLSIDAGWDASESQRQPVSPTAAPTAVRVAPAPTLLPTESDPTPVDPEPVPAP